MKIQEQFSLKQEKTPTNITVQGIISIALIEEQKRSVIDNLKKEISFDGFRDETVTDDMVIQKVGNLTVWTQAGIKVVQTYIAEILATTNTITIDQPHISIQDAVLGGTIGFSITVNRYPDIILPDYKKIAKKEGILESIHLTDNEVEQALLQVRKDLFIKEHKGEVAPEMPPPLTDEQVKNLNPEYNTVDQFVQKFRHNFAYNKEYTLRANRRAKILENIIMEMKVEIPKVFVDREVELLVEGMRDDAKKMSTTLESYLKEQKKDMESLKEEMRESAEKKVRVQIALNEISLKENINPTEKKIKQEKMRIQARDSSLSEKDAYTIATSILSNEEVFLLLEKNADDTVD